MRCGCVLVSTFVIETDVCFLDHFVHTYTYLGGVTVLVSTSCMAMWDSSWTFLACLPSGDTTGKGVLE